MSRILYPGLGADPLDTLSPGAAAFGGRPRSPTAAALPDIPPDEQSSMLGDLMESSLGGLAYVGKVADKLGRPVRGAIDLVTGGKTPASELLSFLPFSDALGITQEKNTVQGTDITNRLGLTDPAEKDSLLNMAAGFGAELLTDPLTYVGVGALTRAGKAAEKTGTLTKGLAPKIAAGEASLFGVGLPFQPPLLHLGTGRAAQAVAGGLDAAKAGLAATAPVRAVRAALDPLVGGAYNRAAQMLNEDVLRPTVRGLERDASERYVEFLQRADPFVKQDDRGVADVVRLAAEGFTADAHRRAAAAFGADGPAVVKIGEDLGAAARSFQQAEAAAGLNTRELTDAFAEYLTRSKNHLPRKAGEGWFEYLRRSAQEFSTTHGSQTARDDLFRDVPGGTVRINEWAKDPALRGMTPLQRDAYFRQELTGSPAINPDKAINEKAARLGKWVEGLPAEHVTDGLDFFRPDPFADFLLRGRRSAQALGGAETVFEGIKRYAEPVAQIAARGGDGVPVNELLRKLALDSVDPAGHAVGPERAAALLGVGQNDLKGYAVPADIANDVLKLGRAWATPTELGPLAAGWDALSNLFKTWVTTPFAAFHSRNLMSGFFNQWRDDAFSLGANKQAMDVLRGGQLAKPLPGMAGATPQEWTDQLVREAVAGRVAFTRDSGRGADTAVQAGQGLIARAPGPDGGGLLDWAKGFVPEKGKVREQLNPFNVEGVNRDRDVNVFVKQMRAAQGAIDDWVQLGHYISKRQAGYAPEQAALAVKKYHNDYCVDEATQILTQRGWLNWDQVTTDDVALTINPETRQIEWQPVLKVNIFDFDGELTHWSHTTFDAMTTDNHRWPVELGKGPADPARPLTFCTTGDVVAGRRPRLAVAGGTPAGAAAPYYDDELVELAGWYIAEGWQNAHNSQEVLLAQSDKHNPEHVASIRRLIHHFADLGCTVGEYQPRDVGYGPIVTFRLGRGVGDQLVAALDGKSIPMRFLTRLTAAQADKLFGRLMDGDGHVMPNGTRLFSQKDQTRTDGFQALCCMMGLRTRSRANPANGCKTITVYKPTPLYTENLDHKRVRYVGKVWCPTTANGTWMARRNGVTYWTGNSDLTGTERNVLRRVFPWYSFSRKALPPLLEDLATKPAKVQAALRLTTGVRDPGEFTPGYVAEGASLPIPGAPDGSQRYISSFGLPIEDEAFKTLGSFARGDVTRGLQSLLGMAQPQIKVPLEQAFGTQLFTGRRLEDLRAMSAVKNTGLLDEENARVLSQVIANSPASRFASSLDKLLDDRKGTIPTAVNLLLGARISDVDAAQQRDLAAKRLLQEQLRGKPGVRVAEDVYVPVDKLPLLDPLDAQLYALYRSASKSAQEVAKARKEKAKNEPAPQ